MIEFDDKEFDDLMYPVHLLSDKDDTFKKFPIFQKYKEFTTDCKLPLNKVLKYIAFMYDSKTPFFTINNLTRRKIEAAILAGFKIGKDDKFDAVTDSMIKCVNPITNAMILRYCRMQKNTDWTQLVVFEESYNKQLEKMVSDDTENSEKTKDLINNVNTLKKDIVSLTMVLLNGDVNKSLMDFMYDEIEEEQLLIRPELIAQAMKDGHDIISYLKDGSER
jgi:uncharacterized protein YbcC (UPF0753/DUF2309 family)